MNKLSAKQPTRAQALNSLVNILFLVIIAFFFLDAFALLAANNELVLSNLVSFSPITLLGGVSALAICFGLYYAWLEFGINIMTTLTRDNDWFKKPFLSMH